MARSNDYSDHEAARALVIGACDDMREWFKDVEDADDAGAQERAEQYADNALTYHYHAWLIVHNYDLEHESSELNNGDSLQSLATAVAYDFLVNEAMNEWNDIQAEIDNGDVFWCPVHKEWEEQRYTCDDCDDPLCADKVVEAVDGEKIYCADCADDHRCVDCQELKSDTEYSYDARAALCPDCLAKRMVAHEEEEKE